MKTRKRKNKGGRPRKEGMQRYAGSGRIIRAQRGETREEVQATVIAYRSKTVDSKSAHRDEAGFELGRAYIRGWITKRQLEAGKQWAINIDLNFRLKGIPSPFPKAMDYGGVSGASVSSHEPDAVRVKRISNDVMQAATAVGQLGREVCIACKAVCLEESPCGGWPEHTQMALAKGLEALADHYGIQHFEEDQRRAG